MFEQPPDIPAFLDRRKKTGQAEPPSKANVREPLILEEVSENTLEPLVNSICSEEVISNTEKFPLGQNEVVAEKIPYRAESIEETVATVIEDNANSDNFFDEMVKRSKIDPGAPFEIDSLANLTNLQSRNKAQFERIRSKLKDSGIRVSELDKALTAMSDSCQESVGEAAQLWPEYDPWPDLVDGTELLDSLVHVFNRYMKLPKGASETLALWVLHTHSHDTASISPILAITSPTPECGKTTLLTLLGALTPKALSASNITAASMFRAVEKWRPTLLVDEADTFLAGSDELRGIINSGHSRLGAFVIRTTGNDHEPRQFSTWAPKAIALIGKLPATLASRAIPIELQRMAPGETVESVREDRLGHLKPLLRRAARWTADYDRELREVEPGLPEVLTGRRADNWRHLIAIADVAGGHWPERARRAAEALTAVDAGQTASIILLQDLRNLFAEHGTDRLLSCKITSALADMEDRPWPEWKAGKAITSRQLARLLEPFGISPTTIRAIDGRGKGYRRDAFTDSFTRYLPDHPCHRDKPQETAENATHLSVTTSPDVTDTQASNFRENSQCHGVTDSPRESEETEPSMPSQSDEWGGEL